MAWTNETKTPLGTQEEYNLLIGGGYKLLVGATYLLNIQSQSGASWANESKTSAPTWTNETQN